MQTPPPDSDRLPAEESHALGPPVRPVLQLARHVWTPVSIPKPVIYAELERLPWPERSAEVVVHALLSTEFWLSRSGWLREWVRFNLWLAVVLVVSTVLVLPPVTAILEGARDWSGLVSVTLVNVNTAVSGLPPIVLALATAFLGVKLFKRHFGNRQHQHPYSN